MVSICHRKQINQNYLQISKKRHFFVLFIHENVISTFLFEFGDVSVVFTLYNGSIAVYQKV